MDDKTRMDFIKLLNENYEKFLRVVDSYRNEVLSFKDGVYDRMDKVYGEVLKVRDEQVAHSQQHDNVNDRLEKLESRSYAHRIKKTR